MNKYIEPAQRQLSLMQEIAWDDTFPPVQSDRDNNKRNDAVRRLQQACDYAKPGVLFMNADGQVFFVDQPWGVYLGRTADKLVVRFATIAGKADILPPRMASINAAKDTLRRYLNEIDIQQGIGGVEYQRRAEEASIFAHGRLSKVFPGMFHIDDRPVRAATARYASKFGLGGYVIVPAPKDDVVSLFGRALFEFAYHAIAAYDAPFRREKARRVSHRKTYP